MTPPARPGRAGRTTGRLVVVGIVRTLLSVVGVLLLYYVLPLDKSFDRGTVLTLLAGLLGFALLVAWQIRSILRSRAPALRAVESLALSIPLFLVVFAAVYSVLGTSDPDAFSEPLSRTDSLYFVVTVFATVGFGDISPVSTPARVLTTVQMVADLVLIGLVLRVFLTAVDRGRRRTADGGDGSSRQRP
jgi:hypothetical protein